VCIDYSAPFQNSTCAANGTRSDYIVMLIIWRHRYCERSQQVEISLKCSYFLLEYILQMDPIPI